MSLFLLSSLRGPLCKFVPRRSGIHSSLFSSTAFSFNCFKKGSNQRCLIKGRRSFAEGTSNKNRSEEVGEKGKSSHRSGWRPTAWSSGTTDYVFYEAQVLARLLERTRKFHRALYISIGCLGLGSVLLFFNWEFVKRRVGQEGAEVLREGIKSENLQLSAADFSKALLNEILHDTQFIGEVSKWLLNLLDDMQPQLSALVVQVLQSEHVISEIKKISDGVVEHLCNQQWVQHRVGELLVAAISTEYSRNMSAQWSLDLLSRKDVWNKVVEIVNTAILNDPLVKAEATKMASEITAEVLRDPSTIQISQEHLSAVLGKPEFQAYAGNAAWSAIKQALSPKWFAKSPEEAVIETVEGDSIAEPKIEPYGSMQDKTPIHDTTTTTTTSELIMFVNPVFDAVHKTEEELPGKCAESLCDLTQKENVDVSPESIIAETHEQPRNENEDAHFFTRPDSEETQSCASKSQNSETALPECSDSQAREIEANSSPSANISDTSIFEPSDTSSKEESDLLNGKFFLNL